MTKIFESIEEYEFALEDSFEQIKREIKYQVEVLNKEDTIEKIAEIEKGFSAFSHEFLAREDIAELLSFGEELESLSEKFYQNRLRLHLGMIEFVEDDVHDFINNIENKLDEIKLNSNNPKPQQHNIIIEK